MEISKKDKLGEIINGWGNWVFRSPEVEKLEKENWDASM